MADITKLLPIIDQLAKPGELSTEWKAAQASSRMAQVLMIVGLLGTVAGCINDAFGGSKLGIVAGGIAGTLGVLTQMLGQLGYTSSRTAVKTQAAQLANTVAKAPGA